MSPTWTLESFPEQKLDIGGQTWRVSEENPLVFHLEDPTGQPSVVLVVLATQQVPHSEVFNKESRDFGGELQNVRKGLVPGEVSFDFNQLRKLPLPLLYHL